MGMVTGGQLVARMLKEERVRHVFTLSGLHVAPIYAGLVEEGIAVVDTRHEQAAAHAADAYARITRGVGVAVVTAGPGVTDALTGVANANAANSPLILLGGAAPLFNQSRGSLQEMEQVDLFHRISKWSDRVPSPELVPLYMAKAFRVALSGRPGPVFLELAWDVLCNGVDESALQIPPAVPDPRPRRAGSGGGGRGPGAARRRRAPGDDRRLERVLGRRPGRAPRLRRAGADPHLPERRRPRLPPAGPSDVLPAHPEGGAHRGRPGLRGGHPVRLPPQLRGRADVQRRLEDRPGRHRSHRGGAQPAGGRGAGRRQPLGALGLRRRGAGRPPGPRTSRSSGPRRSGSSTRWRNGRGAMPSPSTTTGWRRSSRTSPTPATATPCSSPTAETGWPWRRRC